MEDGAYTAYTYKIWYKQHSYGEQGREVTWHEGYVRPLLGYGPMSPLTLRDPGDSMANCWRYRVLDTNMEVVSSWVWFTNDPALLLTECLE